MSLDNGGTHKDTRSSALWGTGNRGGDSRANALWGKGGRGLGAILTVLFVTAIPLAGAGKNNGDKGNNNVQQGNPTYVDPAVKDKVKGTPNKLVNVIIQSDKGFPKALKAFHFAQDEGDGDHSHVNQKLKFVDSVAVSLPAKDVELLLKVPGLTITLDSRVKLTSMPSSNYVWPTAEALRPFYAETDKYRAAMPTIAVVDSGIEKNRADFDNGARVLDEQVITKLLPNSPGDGRGHGTFVAGIAAGSAAGYAGAAPAANIVSLDVMDDSGMARTSDVIAAAEWIYLNKDARNIRVANFSLHSTVPSNFTKDPLDRAVEKLWFSGVTVVVAAGNYGHEDGPSGVLFAPGNDPFVITVGAVDLDGTVKIKDHDVPGWSAYGYTYDGFRKPEVAAAGRFMVGPVSMNASLKLAKPANVLSPGYMRLSGTSFASPVVAGAAAQILARHPSFTPDQVKGALMQTARHIPEAPPGSAGVGEINAYRAAMLNRPPNPNLALNKFVVPDPLDGKTAVFDGASWIAAAKSSSSWDAVSWSDASWSDVSWLAVSWSDVSWSDVSWSDVTWSDVLAVADVTWEDAAESETGTPSTPDTLSPADEAAALADPLLGLAPPPPPPPPSPPPLPPEPPPLP
jgi:serine protease AprX